jgi:hypothetical protein
MIKTINKLKSNLYYLQFASDEMKNNIIKIAINNDGYALKYALQYASDELKNNFDIVFLLLIMISMD